MPVMQQAGPTNGPFYTANSGGESSEMGSGAGIDNWARQFNFAGSVDYNRSFRKWDVYSQFNGIMSIVIHTD